MNPGKIVTFYVSLEVCRFWWQSATRRSNTLIGGETTENAEVLIFKVLLIDRLPFPRYGIYHDKSFR